MGKFSDYIRFPGDAGPDIREGIKNLGFVTSLEIGGFVSFSIPQYLEDAEKARAQNNMGLGGLAVLNSVDDANWSGADLSISNGGTGASSASAARTNLGVAVGTDVQAYDAGLASIAGLTTSANQLIYLTAPDTYATTVFTAAGRALLDDADAAAQRTTLGLGTLAILSSVNNGNWSGTALALGNGGTGATTAAAARTNLGLGNVDNTSDANKPVSTAQQAALNLKANLASPALTGTPTAPTPAAGDNSTRLATTAYVDGASTGGSSGPVTLTGASIDIPGIPASAKIVTLTFSNVTLSANAQPIMLLGTAAAFATTGYLTAAAGQAGTSTIAAGLNTAIPLSYNAGNSGPFWGVLEFRRVGNAWSYFGKLTTGAGALTNDVGGVNLADALTRIRITTVAGTPTFTGTVQLDWI